MTTTATRLRAQERKRLLAHLDALAAPDPDERAEAARKAADLLARKGLSWAALIPKSDKAHGADREPPTDWRADVLALLTRPDLDPSDRAFLHKLAGWRAPGADGLRRLREAMARTG